MQFEELYPFCIPDLYGSPLVVSGRYNGKFPDIVEAKGIMADMSTRVIDVKVRNAKSIPLDRVCARREIDSLKAHVWLDQNTQLEETLAPVLEYSGIEVIRRFHKGGYLDVKVHAAGLAVSLKSAVINAEYRISGTHVNPLGLKSDALMDVIWNIMQYVG
ncbi:putative von Willebrand factor A-like domain superfamily protein [Tanacetum coccineum]